MTEPWHSSMITSPEKLIPSQPVRTTDDLPREHWIARQLPPGTSLRAFAEDEAISVLTSAAQEAIEKAGLTRAEVARALGTTKSYVSQVLNGSANMTLRTLGALFWAAGRQVRRVSTVEVGGELAPVAELRTVIAFQMHIGLNQPLSIEPDTAVLANIDRYNSIQRTSPAFAR